LHAARSVHGAREPQLLAGAFTGRPGLAEVRGAKQKSVQWGALVGVREGQLILAGGGHGDAIPAVGGRVRVLAPGLAEVVRGVDVARAAHGVGVVRLHHGRLILPARRHGDAREIQDGESGGEGLAVVARHEEDRLRGAGRVVRLRPLHQRLVPAVGRHGDGVVVARQRGFVLGEASDHRFVLWRPPIHKTWQSFTQPPASSRRADAPRRSVRFLRWPPT